MAFLLVPHEATARTATVWIGAFDEEDVRTKSVAVEFSGGGDNGTVELNTAAWQRWKSYRPLDRTWFNIRTLLKRKQDPKKEIFYYQRVTLGAERERSLQPRTSYFLKLRIDGQTVTPEDPYGAAQVTTLPEELPLEENNAFTLLLGSCFYRFGVDGSEDKDGLVGKTYYHMGKKPDIKVLCGDQVYLDNPWRQTTLKWNRSYSQPGLFRATLLQRYLENWRQVQGENQDAGFRQLLKNGANYFCSDDHEFWNNAPNFGGVAFRHTFRRIMRDWYFREALELYKAFQSPSPLVRFRVGPLSFCIADTRVNRDIRGMQFMDDEDLLDVKRWIDTLEGPGILVIGQPLLAKENVIRTVRDRSLREAFAAYWSKGFLRGTKGLRDDAVSFLLDKDLPDYRKQYHELISCIAESDHSIVVLTGDVHFGRVAHGDLKRGDGDKFIEVIASPMKLVPTPRWRWTKLRFVDEHKYGTYYNTNHYRHVFPNLKSEEVAHEQDHFATIELVGDQSAKVVNMKVRSWPIQPYENWPTTSPEGERSPISNVVLETALPLKRP